MNGIKPLSHCLAIAFGGSLVLASAGVYAQDAQKQERIEVTGSSIKRTDTETASPVQIITREDIEKSGKQTITDVIRSLPVDNNGSISASFSNGFAAGASGVSLRGLSVNSTLVLINGRRMAPYGLGDDGQRNFVDLSSIPLDAVEQVEILKDGASALYGSDAIAGVVNIKLRRDYQGFSANLGGGTSRYSDGNEVRGTFTAGFGDLSKDKYNFFFNVEASTKDKINQADRRNRKWIGGGSLEPYGYDDLSGSYRGYVVPGVAVSASPNGAVRVPNSGFTYQDLPGCTSTLPRPAGATSGCVWDIVDWLEIQPKETRLNLYGKGSFDLASGWQAYAEIGRFETKVETQFTPASVSSAWPDAFNNTIKSNAGILLPGTHPDNFTGTTGRLRYVTADLGGRGGNYDTVVTRLLGGLKGTVFDWDFDAGLMYAESATSIERHGYIRNSVLRDYLNATNLSGQNPNLLYYRLGANSGLNSQAIKDAISPALNNKTKTSITSLDAKISKELTQLSGGALGLALGAELRRETLDSPATPYTTEADIVGLGYSAFKGTRNVSAVFAELNAPVTKTLELSAAARFDHYSDYGNSFTPKLGAKWKPMSSLALRGTYAEGFRAPGAAENGTSASAGFTTYYDPIRCPVTNAAADCGSGQLVVITSGNKDVKPEKSQSFTLGLVFEPTKDTSITLDFWQITRKDEISQADPNAILDNPANFPNAQIVRDVTTELPGIPGSGIVQAVSAPYVNASKTFTNGIDLDVQQKFSLGEYGRLTANLLWTYTHKNTKFLPLPDGTQLELEYAGTHGPTALSGNAGLPRNRGSFGLSWDKGAWTVATQVNYVSSMKNTETAYDKDPVTGVITPAHCLNAFADGSDAPNGCSIPSFTTVDIYAKWKAFKNFEIYGSIQNLFDKIAPLDPQTYGAVNYNPTFHLSGAVGRFYRIGFKYQWK